ncbi:MAG: hypothetical protein ACLFV1_08610 [Thiohalophilus sp.]
MIALVADKDVLLQPVAARVVQIWADSEYRNHVHIPAFPRHDLEALFSIGV